MSDTSSDDLNAPRRALLGAVAAAIGGSAVLSVAACATTEAQSAPPAVRNIVLVHGAWADGSGWEGVHRALTARGYKVSIVQNPLT